MSTHTRQHPHLVTPHWDSQRGRKTGEMFPVYTATCQLRLARTWTGAGRRHCLALQSHPRWPWHLLPPACPTSQACIGPGPFCQRSAVFLLTPTGSGEDVAQRGPVRFTHGRSCPQGAALCPHPRIQEPGLPSPPVSAHLADNGFLNLRKGSLPLGGSLPWGQESPLLERKKSRRAPLPHRSHPGGRSGMLSQC